MPWWAALGRDVESERRNGGATEHLPKFQRLKGEMNRLRASERLPPTILTIGSSLRTTGESEWRHDYALSS